MASILSEHILKKHVDAVFFLKRSLFKIISCAFYDIGFWAGIKLGYSLISTEYDNVY